MKSIIKTISLTFAAAALITSSAKAYSYSDGDLFLGFYSTTAAKDYLLYIGNYSNYATDGGAYTGSQLNLNSATGISIGTASQINADLTSVFGSGWFADSSVKWGVAGTLDYFGTNTMFVTDPNATGSTTNWSSLSSSDQQISSGDIAVGLSSVYGAAPSGGATAAQGQIQTKATTGSYYYYSKDGGNSIGASFEYYSGGIDTATRTNSLTELVATDAGGGALLADGAHLVLGNFTVGSDGTITYSAVPAGPGQATLKFENSTYSVSESGSSGHVSINIIRGGDTTSACSVNFSTTVGTAVSGTDYTGQTNTLVSFLASQTTAAVTVDIADRNGYQGDRSFTAGLSGASLGASVVSPSSATVTIQESSPAPAAITGLSPTHGPGAGGISVIITGTSLSGATAVTFGIAAATSFTVNSDTQITAVAPAGTASQTVDVSVTTPGNTTASTAADHYTYDAIVIPSPAITGLNPTHGPAAGGTSVVITGTNLTGATAVTFGLTAATSFTVDSDTQVTAVAPAGAAGQKDVKVTTPGGTTANTAADDYAYDSPPAPGQITFSAAAYQSAPVNNHAIPVSVAITLTRTSGTFGAISVVLSATGGTLTSGSDYTFANPTTVNSTTVNFANGQVSASANIQLNAIAPVKLTGTGTILLGLSNATGGASVGAPASATVRIAPADAIAPGVIVTAPKKGTVAASFDVTGVASDAAGIDRVEITLNSGTARLATLGTFTSGTATFTLHGLQPENGKNTLVVQSVDLQGNKSAPVTVSLNYTNNRPQLAGAYNGLLVSGSGVTLSNSVSGFVTMKVTSAGLFSGKVSLGGFVVPVAGIFSNDGTAYFNPALLPSFALVGKAKTPVQLGNLSLVLATGSSGKITGTLKSSGSSTLANLDADRAFYDGKTTFVDPKFLANKGLYTVVVGGTAQQGSLAISSYPQGDGFGSITISAKGIATFKGTLPDGTKVTAAAPLSKNYQWPCFAQLYSKLGSIAVKVNFDDSTAISFLRGLDLLWFRPAISTAKFYPAGWTGGITVDLLGSAYALPPKLPVVSTFPGLNAVNASTGNATLEFTDGKLSGVLDKSLNVDTSNKVTNLSVSAVIDKSFSLKITPASGLIGGSFTHTDTTKTAYKGVIVQHDINAGPYILKAGGYGYFLSTPPKVTGGTGESGGVTLFAK